MFKKWLESNDINGFDFSTPLFPKANERAFWDNKYDRLTVETAERFIGFDWPIMKATDYMAYIRQGDRVKQETPFFNRRMALIALILGEIIEYKGRFIDDIINGVFAICEETYWGLSAHRAPVNENENIPGAAMHYIDLFASDTAEMLSVVYYTLYDELDKYCPEILLRIEYEIERRVIKPYLEHADFWWMGYNRVPNNWNPWILANILTVFLLVEKRHSVFNVGIKKMLTEINSYYVSMPDDGGCDEGCGYWLLAGGKLIEFCDQLNTATSGRINLFKDEKLKNIARYIYRAYIGEGWFVNFADGSPKVTESNVSYVAYLCGVCTGDEQLLTLSKDLSQNYKRDPERLTLYRIKRELGMLMHAEDIAAQSEYRADEQYILPELQNSFMREGKWFYAAKGGHNDESHNHNDIGSFLVFYDNKPVLVDPGCGMYTKKTFSPERYDIWTMQSGWHSLPVINGVEQCDGKDYRADRFCADGKRTEISCASAYPDRANVKTVDRTLAFDGDAIIIRDGFVFERDQNSVCEHFITPLKVTVDGNCAVIDDKFCISADIDCTVSVENIDFESDEKLKSSWGKDGMNRIKFCFDASDSANIVVTLRRI